MDLVDALKQLSNQTRTSNGAFALKSTGSDLLDLYGCIGALRSRPENEIEVLFSNAFAEDKLLAMKLLFYARDIRGGLGEVRTFQIILEHMANLYPTIVIKNFKNIVEFGRWDDLFVLIDTPCEKEMWGYVSAQLKSDIANAKANRPISLLAKWLKSPKTSSSATSKLGRYTAKKLGLSTKEYRLILSKLRSHLKIVEKYMSSNNWSQIDYKSVPSKAMKNYRGAFQEHDPERFMNYLGHVRDGSSKINSSTLYPYDIVEKIIYRSEYSDVLEAQWNALPDYVGDSTNDILVMADTSGSMWGRPMATSVGLAIYFAERNKGAYNNVFLTFSESPCFIQLKGSTLYEKIKHVMSAPWGMNTDFQKAMKLILKTAIKFRLAPDKMPKSIVVITDMEFDFAIGQGYYSKRINWDFYSYLEKEFKSHGYAIPNIVFWNVNSTENVFHASSKYKGVQLVSGHSPAIFKTVLNSIGKTPTEAMLMTLNDPRYDSVEI